MKDFPMFPTEHGMASLVLKEVPYRKEAYIIIQSSEEPELLLEECISFCRMVGAEKIYARGHEILERYPPHCDILEMRGDAIVDESQVRHLWPVTPETVESWRGLLNERLSGVDNAGTLERSEENNILEQGGAYFVHSGGELLGAGWLGDGELRLVASVQRGAGEQVMHTLLSLIPRQQVRLQVASTNAKALRLYERMGFVTTARLHRWYRVF